MRIEEIRSEGNFLLEILVDNLGMDGEFFVSNNKCPSMFVPERELEAFVDPDKPALGKFLTAGTKSLESFLDRQNLEEATKQKVMEKGLILINNKYKKEEYDEEAIVTYIHEKIHASRMLLANVEVGEKDGIDAMFYDDRYVLHSDKREEKYIDPAQDILLASIDDSEKTVDKYKDMSIEEKEEIQFRDQDHYNDKLHEQYKIDEALVETMALTAYLHEELMNDDLMDTIRKINEKTDLDDVRGITNIILRHGDLDLFRWMIDPLTYQNGDIHYDFFSHYITEEDKEDVIRIRKARETMFDDDAYDRRVIESRKHL